MPEAHRLPADPTLAHRPLHELADELEAAYDHGLPLPPAVVFEVLRRALLAAPVSRRDPKHTSP